MATEKCKNPFKKKCNRTDIVVTIWVKGKEHPICKNCWKEFGADGKWGDKEW